MCGITGYIGKNYSKSYIIEGLSRLEYRGYDSAGFACIDPQNQQIVSVKVDGTLAHLIHNLEEQPIDGHTGIGHIRWSTHGVPNVQNAHPHFDCERAISVVHNGIIENYHSLREQLLAEKHVFASQTDTETVAHLLEALLKIQPDLVTAVSLLVSKLEGAFSLVFLLKQFPDMILVVRKKSPLCVGIGAQEMFIASDQLAFAGSVSDIVFLPDDTFALIKHNELKLYNFAGFQIPYQAKKADATWLYQPKQQFEHYMLKEILEQKKVIYDTVQAYRRARDEIWQMMGITADTVRHLACIEMIACGTSYHAARIAQFFFEEICEIPVKVHIASEFRSMHFFKPENTLYITVSQSGETADTLECLRLLHDHGQHVIALTNTPASTMVREAPGFLLTHAGPEIAVATTKTFSAQITVLYWLAHIFALHKGLMHKEAVEKAEQDLLITAEILENSIEQHKEAIITKLAPYYAQFKHAIFLGRHLSFPLALESALKLKEISYIFTDCYPAGELKHGSIALVDAQTPLFLFSSLHPHVYKKIVSAAQEVKARSGHLVIFAFEGQKELIELADQVFLFPQVAPLLAPLACTGVMQFFVYHIAKVLGRPIDKPRNLAKSVTVE